MESPFVSANGRKIASQDGHLKGETGEKPSKCLVLFSSDDFSFSCAKKNHSNSWLINQIVDSEIVKILRGDLLFTTTESVDGEVAIFHTPKIGRK